jgi:hypothetical protein
MTCQQWGGRGSRVSRCNRLVGRTNAAEFQGRAVVAADSPGKRGPPEASNEAIARAKTTSDSAPVVILFFGDKLPAASGYFRGRTYVKRAHAAIEGTPGNEPPWGTQW